MYIQKLKLNKFRGAHDLSLALHKQVNVFFGINGAGKSSILDATTILLSWLVNRIKNAGASGRPITESDIKNGESAANLEIVLQDKDRIFQWNIAKVRKGHMKRDIIASLKPASELAQQVQDSITQNNGQANLPFFAYYPVNRAVLDIPLRIREKHRFDLLAAYDNSLTSGVNFRSFFEWFREREDLENEARRDQQIHSSSMRTTNFPDPQLEAVRGALSKFLPQFKNLTVRRNPLRMELEKDGERLMVNQLSDGEKCLLAMVGDMARRMAIANPLRSNPLVGDGIVLIDEIDLHLHPMWQRLLVPRLADVFTNCQFLISTHSPHIINHVQPENLFLLQMAADKNLSSLRPEESYGKTVERVLEDLMGIETTRPTGVKNALRQIYEYIDIGPLAEAEKLIRELEKKIGKDPELLKANVLIKRKELIGK